MISGRVIRAWCALGGPEDKRALGERRAKLRHHGDGGAEDERREDYRCRPRTTSEKDGEIPIFEKYISAAMP